MFNYTQKMLSFINDTRVSYCWTNYCYFIIFCFSNYIFMNKICEIDSVIVYFMQKCLATSQDNLLPNSRQLKFAQFCCAASKLPLWLPTSQQKRTFNSNEIPATSGLIALLSPKQLLFRSYYIERKDMQDLSPNESIRKASALCQAITSRS